LSGEAHCLHVVPFLDDKERGVFATRAPVRPNAIGFSVVKLVAINGCALHIEDVDMIDGTPLLDIKPYVPEFDAKDAPRIGWLSKKLTNFYGARADERFVSK
jgi:tRNA-Thr(GGU) m(6)t(6)A37 methyltransferase TsaA